MEFDELLEKIYADWPAEVELSAGRLAEVAESIAFSWRGEAGEVMIGNLHEAVYDALLGVSNILCRVRLRDLRTSELREKFEARLLRILRYPELDYPRSDLVLISRYFSSSGIREPLWDEDQASAEI